MAQFNKRQKRKIKKARRTGGPVGAQALKEKFRAKKGLAQTRPGEGFGSGQQAGQWASDMSHQQAIQNSMMGAPASQTDMYGNQMQWNIDPETGRASSQMNLSDYNQGMLQGQQGFSQGLMGMGQQAMGQAQNAMSSPYSYQGISDVPGQGDLMSYRGDIEKKLYDQQSSLIEPEHQRQMQGFEQMAAQRGWTPGSEAYENEKSRLEQSQAQARQGWAGQATQQGLGEMQGMYGMSTQDRQRQIAEMQDLRYRGLQDAQNLFGAAGGPQQGQFQQAQFGQAAPQNFGSMAMGYDQMNQAPWTANQNFQNQMAMAQFGVNNRGGGYDAAADAQQMQNARDQMLWEQEHGFRGNANSKPKTDWAGMAGNVAGSALQGWASGGFQGF